jgi:hypothetical protein
MLILSLVQMFPTLPAGPPVWLPVAKIWTHMFTEKEVRVPAIGELAIFELVQA